MTLLPGYDYQMMPSIMNTISSNKLDLGPVSPLAALASCDDLPTTNCSVNSSGKE